MYMVRASLRYHFFLPTLGFSINTNLNLRRLFYLRGIIYPASAKIVVYSQLVCCCLSTAYNTVYSAPLLDVPRLARAGAESQKFVTDDDNTVVSHSLF
jgi:hypothetical protein